MAYKFNVKSFVIGFIFLSTCAPAFAGNEEFLPHIHNERIMTEIISEPSGARIEVNNQYVGETPVKVHIYRTYNKLAGWDGLTITANPIYPGQYVQQKYIQRNEPTPTKVFFDMALQRTSSAVNVNINNV